MIDLKHGDCLELMRDIPDGSVDLVLCDLPYGIDYQSARRTDKTSRFKKISNDEKPFIAPIPMIPRLLTERGGVLLFTRWDVQQVFCDAMEEAGLPPKSIVIWDKQTHSMGDLYKSFGRRYESIIWACGSGYKFPAGRPTDIIAFPCVAASSLVHPNQKPVGMLERLIRMTTRHGDTVLDFTMGSGSTGVACVNTGRNFIGIEKDDRYFEIARKRIEDAERERKGSLFDMDALDAETERREQENWLFEEDA